MNNFAAERGKLTAVWPHIPGLCYVYSMGPSLPQLTSAQVKAGQLYPLVEDLHRVSPWHGLLRYLPCQAVLVFLMIWTLGFDGAPFAALALATGVIYASTLILTHDALHHTLTGWAWFDELAPRILSYPALWPHGLYSELHKIHHKMNSVDLQDPERVQWTREEYDRACPLGKWTARNQWWLALFLWGGFGMIAGHIRVALPLAKEYPRLKRALFVDGVGILAVNLLIYWAAFRHGVAGKYLILYLVLERVAGFVQQLRSHVEHYGLWGREENPIATQIFNSRNLVTSGFGSLYFNRLNYHSAHHAFPRIPFYSLKEATARLDALYGEGRPLPRSASYFRTALRFAIHPELISSDHLRRSP